MATAAALGRIAAPEMIKVGYQPALTGGAIAATGTLGALIPPSILMVLFAVFAQVSVGQMLIAGILPGLLTLAVYVGMISLRCWLDPSIAPRAELETADAEFKAAARRVWPLPVISILVLGGIYGG
jgi:TRAP-type C4-dicarboxylate transport system permease large subunit